MILDSVRKFIFPSRCVICDSLLPFGDKLENEFLCKECRGKLEFIKAPTCKKCGAMMYDEDEMYCTRCKLHMHKSFEYGFGLCRYNDAVKESLHRIKYDGRKEYIEFYGKCIAKLYHDKIKSMNVDAFIPVPVHSARLRERNYNQAAVLAYAISNELKNYGIDIEVREDIILRVKNTKVLNKLDNEARKNELNGAFKVNYDPVVQKALIVDDIYTTGGTINTMANALRDAGMEKVFFAVIAIVDNL